MKPAQLFASFIRLGALWGLGFGLIVGLGLGLPPAVFLSRTSSGCLPLFVGYGLFIGGLTGAALGAFMAFFTLLTQRLNLNPRDRRILLTLAGSAVPFVVGFRWVMGIGGWTPGWPLLAVVTGLILATPGGLIGHSIAKWYLAREYGVKEKNLPEKSKLEGHGESHPSLRHKLDDEEDEQRDIDADEDVRDHQHRAL